MHSTVANAELAVGGQSGSGLGSLSPKLGNLSIVDTAPSSITFNAMVNFTNPTNYSATVPYFNINILANGTILGQGTAQDVLVVPGNNTNVPIRAFFDPLAFSGEEGRGVGREFISQYLSGANTAHPWRARTDRHRVQHQSCSVHAQQ